MNESDWIPLPPGWAVTRFPGTIEIEDSTGRRRGACAQPCEPTKMGELITNIMQTIRKEEAADRSWLERQ
jgi:hypothetical protein